MFLKTKEAADFPEFSPPKCSLDKPGKILHECEALYIMDSGYFVTVNSHLYR